MKSQLHLLHRPSCHLCEVMRRKVVALCANHPVELVMVNVDEDPELRQRYTKDVPVLLTNGHELCRHHLDEAELSDFLAAL